LYDVYPISADDHMGSHFVKPMYRETAFFFLENAFPIMNINS
jgi:hypothetical protein